MKSTDSNINIVFNFDTLKNQVIIISNPEFYKYIYTFFFIAIFKQLIAL